MRLEQKGFYAGTGRLTTLLKQAAELGKENIACIMSQSEIGLDVARIAKLLQLENKLQGIIFFYVPDDLTTGVREKVEELAERPDKDKPLHILVYGRDTLFLTEKELECANVTITNYIQLARKPFINQSIEE